MNDRDDESADKLEPVPWDHRPIFGTSDGLPWWGAILLGLGLTVLGAAIDIEINGEHTKLFQGIYFVGCLAAVCWVRRRSLFGPMVQPPLILAVVLPTVVVYDAGMPDKFELKDALLTYGLPVINSFPTMAFTTGAVLVVGIVRLLAQRDPHRHRPEADDLDDEPPARRRRGKPLDAEATEHVATGAAARPRARRARESADAAPAAGMPPAGDPQRAQRRPADPATGRRARPDGTPARPVEPRGPGTLPPVRPPRRAAAPGVERPWDSPPSLPPGGRRRAQSEPPRRPGPEAEPPPRRRARPDSGDSPSGLPPRRQPPPPRRRPRHPDERP